MDNKKKKQHYVPQCYLQQFCEDNEHLNVFDKDNESIFGSNILDVARELYFYDFPDFNEEEFIKLNSNYTQDMINEIKECYKNFGKGQSVENGFSTIETKFSEVLTDTISKFMDDNKYCLHKHNKLFNKIEKKIMANFIALQITRTKMFRTLLKRVIYLKIRDQVNQIPKEEIIEEVFEKNMEKEAAVVQAMFMGRPEIIGYIMGILIKRYWVIGINETSELLYTSDNPVAYKLMTNTDYNAYNLFVGFVNSDLIVYPLNSKTILIMYNKKHEEKCVKLNKNQIKLFNTFQVKCSTRQLYSKDNNFNLAKKILKKTGKQYKSRAMSDFKVRLSKNYMKLK